MRSQRSQLSSAAALGAVAVLVFAAASLPARAAAQAAGTAGTAAAAPASPAAGDPAAKMKAEMEAYAKLGQPGEHHKLLGNLAGKWKVTGKSWMVPGQPPIDMSSTMEASWMLGGRYLQEVHTGSFMGQPFEGRAVDGYDNVTKEYFSTWIDNMGTGVEIFRGSCKDPCKTLTETAEVIDPMSGKKTKSSEVITFIDPDTFRYEMYALGAGQHGEDTKVMELVAKRQP
jgi:hypothetical protein